MVNVKLLGELISMYSGKGFKASEYVSEGVKLLKINNVGINGIIWKQKEYLPIEYIEKYSKLLLGKGDLVLALNRPILNGELKVGILEDIDAPSILYQRVGKVEVKNHNELNIHFLFWYFKTNFFISNLLANLDGSDQPFITNRKLFNIEFPFLPPLVEQKKIVAKLDELFERIDKSIALLEENIQHTKGLMASVLDEEFKAIVNDDYKPFLSVCDISKKTVIPQKGLNYNYVGLENIEQHTGKLVDYSISTGDEIKSSKVSFSKGSVLYGKLRPYLNKVLVTEFDGVATTEILPIKPSEDLKTEYLAFYMRSKSFVNIANNSTSGARMPRVTTTFFKNEATVPVPSLKQQELSITKLKALSNVNSKLIIQQTEKLNHLKSLKSSLLDKAFKGELV